MEWLSAIVIALAASPGYVSGKRSVETCSLVEGKSYLKTGCT